MKYKFLTLLFAFIASINYLFAQNGTCGNDLTWEISDNILIIKGNGAMTDYSSSIHPGWYLYADGINHLMISEGVTSIGNYAFYGLSDLSTYKLPATLTNIGAYAFYGCTNITEINVPDNVQTIGESAYYGCINAKKLTIGVNMKTINDMAFRNCDGIEEVTWNAKQSNDFTYTISHYYSVNDEYVSKISTPFCYYTYDKFNDQRVSWVMSNVKTLRFGDLVEKVPAVLCCRLNVESIQWSNSITEIGTRAFESSSISVMDYPITVTKISDYAFMGCENIDEIIINDNVTSVGVDAFRGCGNATKMYVGKKVQSIGEHILRGCGNLQEIHWNAKNCADFAEVYTNAPSYTSYSKKISTLFQYMHEWESGNTSWRDYNNEFDISDDITTIVFGPDVISIPTYLCYNTSIENLVIPSNVNYIRDYAFSGCTRLQRINVRSESLLAIANNTFSSVPSNTTVYVPCNTLEDYQNDAYWSRFKNISEHLNIDISLKSNNYFYGDVQILQQPTCNNNNLIINAVPEEGYMFYNWNDRSIENPRTIILTQDTTLQANFVPYRTFNINVTCDDQYGTVVCENGDFDYLTVHSFSAMPNYGYHFTQWSDGATENPRELVLVQDTNFTALFSPNQYSLTIQYDNTFGEIIDNQGSFDYLSEHEIQVNAKYGYHFTEWSDGVTDNPRTLILTKDTTITASFAPNKYQLELIADAEMGTINGEKGSFDYLSEHEITAVPNTGYLFNGWSDGATENPRTITLTRDTSITALFEHNLHTVTLLCDENQGSVSESGDTHHSGSCTITATPNYGYHFTQWTDGDTNNPRTFIVTQDTTFTAEFAVDKNGTCGDELALTWAYDDEAKELTISGEGALNSNYTFGVEAPTSVKKVIFEEGITSVGNSAFANYTTLEEIHFASTIKRIYEQAFYNCENLENIYCYREVPCVVYNNTFDGIDKFSCTLHVPSASIEMYKAATGWRDFYYVIALPEPTPTGIDQLENGKYENVKIVKDGQILILRGEKVYTVTGEEVK